MSLNLKRDRIQIIAEILGVCEHPQTQAYVRRQTNVSYAVLQNCIMQLLVREWLLQVEEECGQKKLSTTNKGRVFLDKCLELEKLAGIKNKGKLMVSISKNHRVNT